MYSLENDGSSLLVVLTGAEIVARWLRHCVPLHRHATKPQRVVKRLQFLVLPVPLHQPLGHLTILPFVFLHHLSQTRRDVGGIPFKFSFQNASLPSSWRRSRPSWPWAPVLWTGSVGSTPCPSASAAPQPVTDCTLDTCAPDEPVSGRTRCGFNVKLTQTFTDPHFAFIHKENDIWLDRSRRPEHGYRCPGLCLVAGLPEPWLYTPLRARARSSRCPASQTAPRHTRGRWRGNGWARRTRADRRKHASKPSPRRSRSAWSDILGSCTGACRCRETWVGLWRVKNHSWVPDNRWFITNWTWSRNIVSLDKWGSK